MTLQLRPARPTDCAELTDVVFRSKQSNGYDDAFMEACREELTISASTLAETQLWVAVDEETILGCAALDVISSSGGEVSLLFIDPDFQRRGVGRMLWTTLYRLAHEQGLKTLELSADPAAVPFYTGLGFVEIGRSPSGSVKGRTLPRMKLTF